MTKLAIVGSFIQLLGFITGGCAIFRIISWIAGNKMLWWETIAILILLASSRYMLREGLHIHSMGFPKKKDNP